MLKMTIDNEEVVSKNNFTIKEEMLSPSSTILNNTYPKTWEGDKNYTSRFYYPKDYAKLDIQNFSITPEEAGTTIDINGSATLSDVDTTKESRVLSLKGQTSQTGTPTPTSPIPVNVVSGDNYINICGKNLLNTNLMTEFTPTQVTWYSLDGVNSFYSVSTIAKSNIYYDVKANKTYTFSVNEYKNINTSVTSPIQLVRGDTAGVVCSLTSSSSFEPTSFTPTEDLRVYPRISVATANVATQCTVQLEAGSTATTYEPHIGHSYPIYLGGTNLFSSDLEQGSLNSSGEITSSTTRIRSKDFISVKNSTQYILSGVSSSTIQAIIYEYNNDTYTEQTSSSWNTLPYTFTTNATTNKIKVVIRYSSNGTITPTEVSNIQLENGSVATKYNHYLTTPIELCKIGDYQDYFYKENKKWYKYKAIDKVVLDGTNAQSGGTTGTNAYWLSTTIMSLNNNDIATVYSNMFTSSSFANRTSGGDVVYSQDGRVTFRTANNTSIDWSSATNRTNWLDANKPIIYYILATPTNTEITDTTLLEQLNDLESQ